MADCDAVNRAFETGEPYPIKMFWSQGSNGIACSATAAPRVHKMLQNVEFCVVADPYMTPTAVAYADIFLPLKTTAERDSMRVWWTPLRAMKAVSEWYEAKSDEELIVALGNKLNPELFQKRWPTLEALLQDYLDVGFNLYDPETGKSYKSAGRSKAGMVEVEDVHTDFWKKHHADGECSFDALVRRRAATSTTTSAPRTASTRRACCEPTACPASRRPPGASSSCRTPRSAPGASRPWPSTWSRFRPSGGSTDPEFRRSTVHLHQRLALLRVLPFGEPPAGNHARVPSPAAREGVAADGRGVRPGRGRVDLDREHRGALPQKVTIDPTLTPALHPCRARLVVPEQEPAFPHLYGAFECNINNLTASYETGHGGIGNPLKSIVCKIYKCTDDVDEPTPGEVVTKLGGFRSDYVAGQPFAWTTDNTTREGGRF